MRAGSTLISLAAITLTIGVLSNRFVFAQEKVQPLPSCDQSPSTTATISPVGAPASLTLRPVPRDDRVVAVGHIYVRNDAVFPLSRWCARGYFLDYLDRPQRAKLSLSGGQQSTEMACVALSVDAGVVQDFELSVEVDQDVLPISGLVTLQASGTAEPQQSPDLKPKKCTANSKEVSQSIVLTSTQSGSHAGKIIAVTALIGGVFLLVCLKRFRSKLPEPMGASQWAFSSSVATNITFVGSLLGTALASNALPDLPHYMTKQSFIVLGLIFAVLAGLAPILYNFCCKPVGPNSTNPTLLDFEGWVWLFLLADSITIWAVCGQLATLGLLFNEFAVRHIISSGSAVCAWCIGIAVGIALLFYCYRTARFYVEEYPAPSAEEPSEAKKVASTPALKRRAPGWTAL